MLTQAALWASYIDYVRECSIYSYNEDLLANYFNGVFEGQELGMTKASGMVDVLNGC